MKHIVSRKKHTVKAGKGLIASMISLSALPTVVLADPNPNTLDTIKVTATAEAGYNTQSKSTKFTAPLIDTPKSVSVISKQLIQETAASSLTDALRNVPGITLGAGEGGNPNGDRPFIRGFNAESAIFVDGVRTSTSQNREIFATEQVEVVKGSSSTLGGAGSTGGSINLISKVAHAGDAVEGNISGGTDSYARVVLDGNKDFGNGIAGRVVVMGHQNHKAGQDNGAEYKRNGVAPSLAMGLDSATRAILSYYYLKTDDIPDSGIPYNNPFSATSPNARLNGNGEPIKVEQGTYYGWKDRDFQKQENQIATFKLEHDLNDSLKLANTTVWSKSKNNYLWTQPDDSAGNWLVNQGGIWRRANTRITDTDTLSNQLAFMGELSTASIKHHFNAGLEYSKQESDKGSYAVTSTTGKNITGDITQGACSKKLGIGAASDYWCTNVNSPNSSDPWLGKIAPIQAISTTQTETKSAYILDTLDLTPQWLLNLGLRWDQFDSEQRYHQASGIIKAGSQYKYNKDMLTYQAGLVFKPIQNGSIYVSYATAANPVGVDGGDGSEGLSNPGRSTSEQQAQAINNLKPETVKTYELGSKWTVLNSRLNLTNAIFRTEKTNTRAIDTDGFTRNIGETRTDGVELGISGSLSNQWDLSFGYTYLDSQQTKTGYTNTGTAAAPKYTPNPDKGLTVPNVAKNSATLWTTYKVLPQVTIGGGATYMDKVFGNTANTKWVPSYVRYDAMMQYFVNRNVNLQLNLNNLSDKRYFTKAYASHYATEAEGRNAILSLNFKY